MGKRIRLSRWDGTREMVTMKASTPPPPPPPKPEPECNLLRHEILPGRIGKKMRMSSWDLVTKNKLMKPSTTAKKPEPEPERDLSHPNLPWRIKQTKHVPYLPDEILFFNILNRAPAKSLFRFRCVNKHWRDAIDDPVFRSACCILSEKNPLLVAFMEEQHKVEKFCHYNFISYGHGPNFGDPFKYLSFPTVDPTIIIGPCNGLFCIRSQTSYHIFNLTTREILSHPSTNSSDNDQVLPPPCPRQSYVGYGFGFGFDPLEKEYKVLHLVNKGNKCMICTLGTDSWRDITETSNVSICFKYFTRKGMVSSFAVYSNGAFFWFFGPNNLLISFNIHKEKFFLRSGPNFPQSLLLPYIYRSKTCLFECQGRICLSYTKNQGSKDVNLYSYKDDMSNNDDPKTPLSWVTTSITFPLHESFDPRFGVMSFIGHVVFYWFAYALFAMASLQSTSSTIARPLSSLLLHSGSNAHVRSGLINHIENFFSLKTLVPPGASQVSCMNMNQLCRPVQEVRYDEGSKLVTKRKFPKSSTRKNN